MASNKPVGDNRRIGAVRKRSQIKTIIEIQRERRWTKRSRDSGRFMAQKVGRTKFKGVRKEK